MVPSPQHTLPSLAPREETPGSGQGLTQDEAHGVDSSDQVDGVFAEGLEQVCNAVLQALGRRQSGSGCCGLVSAATRLPSLEQRCLRSLAGAHFISRWPGMYPGPPKGARWPLQWHWRPSGRMWWSGRARRARQPGAWLHVSPPAPLRGSQSARQFPGTGCVPLTWLRASRCPASDAPGSRISKAEPLASFCAQVAEAAALCWPRPPAQQSLCVPGLHAQGSGPILPLTNPPAQHHGTPGRG